VEQKTLSSFSVEYELNAWLLTPEDRRTVLSMLYQNIQDVFNEYGVQIVSPDLQTQPDKPIVVPKSKWFAPPATRNDTSPPDEHAA